MKRIAHILALVSALAFTALTAQATQVYMFNFDSVNETVPDLDFGGVTDSHTLSGMSGTISDVSVTIHTTGGYNGDLFGYLVSDAGYAVLLNRIGTTASDPFGSASSGMNVTFSDSGSDVHLVAAGFGSVINGTYAPDGRTTSPLDALDTDARTAMLASFVGGNPNGTWTLFLADVSAVGETTLDSWGLSITTVPEPVTVALAAFGVTGAAAFYLRRRRSV